jgi:phosphoribosylaminoimidazole-succinocarboxamide synthase
MAETYDLTDTGERLNAALSETDLPGLHLLARGKVRDVYDLGDRLLIIATDRISAFDSVLGSPIPDKGRVLTQLSLFWFDMFKDIIPHHFLTADLSELKLKPALLRHLTGRSMIVKKAKALPVECVARGYLIGSGWKEYQASGTVCGITLKPGLRMAEKLDTPIFTPATKAESGHDENIPFEKAAEVLGREVAEKVRDVTLKLYATGAAYAAKRGVIIADTKFEFGICDGEVILIDEALTPDSSRFWPADTYKVGSSPFSFDKQFVRDWLEKESGWDKEPPAPALPDKVVMKTREKYLEAYEKITGRKLETGA